MRMELGLASALALLAACGPSKPSTEIGDEGPDDTESGGENEESDTGVPEAMCLDENYADDPQRLEFTELGCVPVEADGTCAECDQACMEAIVYDCPIDTCGVPDLPCINVCGSHVVLCSEQLGDQCCHLVTAEYVGGVPGRPLREAGAPVLPELRIIGSASQDPARSAAAASYREFARYERASVDAFLHAAAVLAELDAPAELVEAHRDAAREELEHARLALSAARAIDGRAAALEPMPPCTRSFELGDFVRDLIHDGCIGELIATHEADWALARVDGDLRGYWAPVARDEASHAALAWRTLEWLLTTHPRLRAQVEAELARALTARPALEHGTRGRFGLPAPITQIELRGAAIAELLATARRPQPTLSSAS